MKTIAEEIDALRAMNVAELTERHVQLFGRLPRCKQPTWLFRKCAWRLQEIRLGGLSETAKARLDELIAEIDIDLGRTVVRRKGPTLGTSVTRVWRGREIRATATDDGRWEHEGAVYRSLSAVAKHITGTHWNGRLFFGLKKRGTP